MYAPDPCIYTVSERELALPNRPIRFFRRVPNSIRCDYTICGPKNQQKKLAFFLFLLDSTRIFRGLKVEIACRWGSLKFLLNHSPSELPSDGGFFTDQR